MDEQQAEQWLRDPNLDPALLASIAGDFPALRPVVASHPLLYPELQQWLADLNDPAVDAALARRVSGPPPPTAEDAAGFLPEPPPSQAPMVFESQQPPAAPSGPPTPQVVSGDAPQKKRLKAPVIAALAVLGGVVAVGLGFLLFTLFSGGEDARGTDYFSRLPDKATVVDLQPFGEAVTLAPISSSSASLREGDVTYVRFVEEDTDLIAAVNVQSNDAYPMWVTPFPTDANDCLIEDSSLRCGSVSIDLKTGVPTRAFSPAASTGAGTPATSGEAVAGEPEDPADTNSVADPDNDSDDGSSGAPTGDSSAQSGEAAGAPERVSEKLADTPSEAIPFALVGGSLQNSKGAVIVEDLGDGDFWVLRLGEGGDRWAISDGSVVIVIEGGEELWRTELPEGSREANSFDSPTGPTWDGDSWTLIMGTPASIVAWDATSGEERWLVETEVSSYQVVDTGVVVTSGPSLAVLDFPDRPEDADDGPPARDEGEPAQDIVLGDPGTEAVQMPTPEEIRNSTLPMPGSCSWNAGEPDGWLATFRNGEQVENPWGLNRTTQMGQVEYTALSGKPAVIISYVCILDMGTSVPILVVYDENMNVVQDLAADGNEWTGSWFTEEPSPIQVEGNTLTARTWVQHAAVDYVIEWVWDGEEYVVYQMATEAGGVLRVAPTVEEVAEQYTGPGRVLGCAPAPTTTAFPPSGYTDYVFVGDTMISGTKSQGFFGDYGQVPGDWVCATDLSTSVDHFGAQLSDSYLFVRTDPGVPLEIISEVNG